MEPERIIADLMRPEAYAHGPAAVELIETHISWIFLAGDLVYKIKKPEDYGFLDFTTLEKRKHFCNEEVRLNRRLAPDVYLEVAAVCPDRDGRATIDGPGEPVEYAVKMKRMPADGMMPVRLARDEIGLETMDRLAALLVDFYRRADAGRRIDRFGRKEVIKHNTDEDFWQTVDFVGLALSGRRYDHIRQYTDAFLDEKTDLLDNRIQGGYIRDCHGDLHMGNICLGDDIWIFDCIEFNESLRFSDVASDLAFLAMDLDFHGRCDLGRRLIDTYIRLSADKGLADVLDFYKCYRAYVRGKINCFTYDQAAVPEKEREAALALARRYFDLAYTYAGGTYRPRILIFFGLMGAGKTFWARTAAQKMGAPVISSDRVRKRMVGLASQTRVYVPFGQGLYAPGVSEKVYALMHAEAEKLAGAGLDVVLDASYMKEAHRRALIDMAARVGAEATFILTNADEQTTLTRLEDREAKGRSMSDGRREIYGAQSQAFEPIQDLSPAKFITLDNNESIEEISTKLWPALNLE